ncbi:hypothetical protein PLESTM_001283200 [Pleodorina starrii]|nr:hypothetical protein PLESTM_001283200 [Pleodorina starrii]
MAFLEPHSGKLSAAVMCLVVLHFGCQLMSCRHEQAGFRVNRATVDSILRQLGDVQSNGSCSTPADLERLTPAKGLTDDSDGQGAGRDQMCGGKLGAPPQQQPQRQQHHLVNAGLVRAVADAAADWERRRRQPAAARGSMSRGDIPPPHAASLPRPPDLSFVVRLLPYDGFPGPRPMPWSDAAPAEEADRGDRRSGDGGGGGGTCSFNGTVVQSGTASMGASRDGDGGGGGIEGIRRVAAAAWKRLVGRTLALLPLTPGSSSGSSKFNLFYAVQLHLAALMPRAALLLAPALSAAGGGVRLPVLDWWDAARLPAFTSPRPWLHKEEAGTESGAPVGPPAAAAADRWWRAGGDAIAVCHLEVHPHLWVVAPGLAGGGQLPHRARRARCRLQVRHDLTEAAAAAAAAARTDAAAAAAASCTGIGASSAAAGAGGSSSSSSGCDGSGGVASGSGVEELDVVVWEELDLGKRSSAAQAAAAAGGPSSSPYWRRLYFSTQKSYPPRASAGPPPPPPPGWLRGGVGVGPGVVVGQEHSPLWTSVRSYLYGEYGGTLYYCSAALCDPSRYDSSPQGATIYVQLVRLVRRVSELAPALLLPHAEVLRWLWPLAYGWSVDLVTVTVAAMCCCFAEWLLVARLVARWAADVADARGLRLDSDTAALMRGRVWLEAVEGQQGPWSWCWPRCWWREADPWVWLGLALVSLCSLFQWEATEEAMKEEVEAGPPLLRPIPNSHLQALSLQQLLLLELRGLMSALRWGCWMLQRRRLLKVAATARMLHDSAAGLTLRQVAAAASLEDRQPPAEAWLLKHVPDRRAVGHVRTAVRWFRGGGRQPGAEADPQRRRRRPQRQEDEEVEPSDSRAVVWPQPLQLPAFVSNLDGNDPGGGGGGDGDDDYGAVSPARARAPAPVAVASPPRGFVCSITHEVMRQPALLLSPQLPSAPSYEREAIQSWLALRRNDPRTNIVLRSYQLVPNDDLRRAIDDWARGLEAAMAAGVGGTETAPVTPAVRLKMKWAA